MIELTSSEAHVNNVVIYNCDHGEERPEIAQTSLWQSGRRKEAREVMMTRQEACRS